MIGRVLYAIGKKLRDATQLIQGFRVVERHFRWILHLKQVPQESHEEIKFTGWYYKHATRHVVKTVKSASLPIFITTVYPLQTVLICIAHKEEAVVVPMYVSCWIREGGSNHVALAHDERPTYLLPSI